jgi:hypothetical protein
MQTNNKKHDPVLADANREKFQKEMDVRAQQQRHGMFSMPLSNTIGDKSTNYQTYRKERSDCKSTVMKHRK